MEAGTLEKPEAPMPGVEAESAEAAAGTPNTWCILRGMPGGSITPIGPFETAAEAQAYEEADHNEASLPFQVVALIAPANC